MNVLFVSPGPDTCGLGIGYKRAFDACGGDWSARAVRMQDSPWHYDADIEWNGSPDTADEVRELWRAADVIHVFEDPRAFTWFPTAGKVLVIHHLGTFYRSKPEQVSAQCREIGATEVADMHDLLRLNPAAQWLPDVIDSAPLVKLRRQTYAPSNRIRIAHAPTNREYKSTAVILPTLERLAARYPVDVDLIENVSNAECIARKARCDVFVDELTLGYGLNALECWSMGIPDVSGVANPDTRALMLADFGRRSTPFLEATADNLEGILEWLISDRSHIETWGEIGRSHVRRFHSQQAVVKRAIQIYEGAA